MNKKRIFYTAAASALMTSSAVAVPYASKIRVQGAPSVVYQEGASINYVLNMAATSVTINVFSAGQTPGVDTPVASFAGTTNAGVNTVPWDGTDTNAGGTDLPIDAGYFLQIQVVGSTAAGIAEITSNRSVGQFGPPAVKETLFNGFSGTDVIIQKDESSDLFGLIAVTSSYNGTTPPHKAVVILNSALDVDAGDDGFDSRVLRHPTSDGVSPSVGTSQDVWTGQYDPTERDRIWATGQGDTTAANGAIIMTATNASGFDQFLTDADPGKIVFAALTYPRGIAVKDIGGTKTLFITRGNNTILRATIDSNNTVVGPPVDILETAVTTRYGKAVLFDSDGNLYWVNRQEIAAGTGGRLYRWNAATVDAATTADALTDANADWIIDVQATDTNVADAAIAPNGDVYLTVQNTGVYLVGNTSSASLVKTLAPGDLVIDFTTVSTGWSGQSSFGVGMDIDTAGNIYITDRSTEQVRAFTPGGASDITVTAPESQVFNIVGAAAATGWTLYQ